MTKARLCFVTGKPVQPHERYDAVGGVPCKTKWCKVHVCQRNEVFFVVGATCSDPCGATSFTPYGATCFTPKRSHVLHPRHHPMEIRCQELLSSSSNSKMPSAP